MATIRVNDPLIGGTFHDYVLRWLFTVKIGKHSLVSNEMVYSHDELVNLRTHAFVFRLLFHEVRTLRHRSCSLRLFVLIYSPLEADFSYTTNLFEHALEKKIGDSGLVYSSCLCCFSPQRSRSTWCTLVWPTTWGKAPVGKVHVLSTHITS